jgi:riboflavin kinase/FMN adenylyltransferase
MVKNDSSNRRGENKIITVSSLDALANYKIKRVSIAFGVFDGIHLGHQKIIKNLIKMSKETDSAPVIVTFFPHPRAVLHPDEPPLQLISRKKKIKLLKEAGVAAVVTMPFTLEFASLEPNIFLHNCLFAPGIEITGICVGSKWRFGAKAAGTVESLKKYSSTHGFKLNAVKEVILNNQTVSSTAIRRLVSSGLLNDAFEMLGRNYSVTGTVIHGTSIASTDLSCPTANITVKNGIIPPHGVYAGIGKFSGDSYPAAISIGVSPTFADKHRKAEDIEVHLIDFKGNLYGEIMEVEFLEYIREERCFQNAESLKIQIENDIEKIRKYILNNKIKTDKKK